jgi:hypothetical protein
MSRDRFVMFSTGLLIALLLGMALSGAFAPAGSDTANGRPMARLHVTGTAGLHPATHSGATPANIEVVTNPYAPDRTRERGPAGDF